MSSEQQPSCGVVASLKRLGWSFLVKSSTFGRSIRPELEHFSLFVETSILHKALGNEIREVVLTVEGSGGHTHLATHVTAPPQPLERTRHIAGLMRHVGVERIVLDTRLEANQFARVVEILWALRHRLERRAREAGYTDHAIADLVSRPGRRTACTITFLDSQTKTLSIQYSYCAQVFSRAVKTFKEHTSNLFRDHRAFFRAAPRFALLAMLLAGMPYLVLAFTPGLSFLGYALIFTAAVATCGAVSFLTYLIFQTIGAIEYDKEQQAWEIEQAYNEITRVHRDLQMDLDAARLVQRMLIPGPDNTPFPDHLAIAFSFQPEMQVGGDYFDFKALDRTSLALVIADVSGHGMSAAFITGLIKTTFELSGDERRSPALFVSALNRRLCEMTPAESFATLFYGVYDVESRLFRYTNAGHGPPPMLVRRAAKSVTALDENASLVAGVVADISYGEGTAHLDPGDKIVLATDGVTEAHAPDGNELFGMDRYQALLRDRAEASASEIKGAILEEVERFEAGASPADDRAVVVLEVIK